LAGCANGVCNPFPVSIAAGAYDTCATINGGPLKCWGRDYAGVLEAVPAQPFSPPTAIAGLESGVRSVAVGRNDACALTTTGVVQCWGPDYGQKIATITALPPKIASLTCASAYYDHECVTTSAGAVKCWGTNNLGQLGNGQQATDTAYQLGVVDVVGLSSGASVVSAGGTALAPSAPAAKCGVGVLGASVNWATGATTSLPIAPSPR
jgi:alpha-tubulin suppressor-like RCC1 family protein